MAEVIRNLKELDDRQIGEYSFEYIPRGENSALMVINEINEPIDLICTNNANRKFKIYNMNVKYKAPLKKIKDIKFLTSLLSAYGKKVFKDGNNWEVQRNNDGDWVYRHLSNLSQVWVDVDIILHRYGYYINT